LGGQDHPKGRIRDHLLTKQKRMKRIIGILLLALSIYLGYTGIAKFSDSSSSVDVLGVELRAENTQQKNTSYLYIGFAVIAAIGGIVLARSDSK
jgi:hypothetical protein